MAIKFNSNIVSIVYLEKDNKRVGSIYQVKHGKDTLFIAKSKSYVLENAYKSIESAVSALEKKIGRRVVYS